MLSKDSELGVKCVIFIRNMRFFFMIYDGIVYALCLSLICFFFFFVSDEDAYNIKEQDGCISGQAKDRETQ